MVSNDHNWKFPDPPNTAVFTSVYVLKDRKTITYVSHEENDGAWQFFTDDVIEQYEDIARIVALSEIVDIDPTLRNLANLPMGYYATRKDRNDPWTVKK